MENCDIVKVYLAWRNAILNFPSEKISFAVVVVFNLGTIKYTSY